MDIGWKSTAIDLENLIKDHPKFDWMPIPEMVNCSRKGLHKEEVIAFVPSTSGTFGHADAVRFAICSRCGFLSKTPVPWAALWGATAASDHIGYIADAEPLKALMSYLLLLS